MQILITLAWIVAVFFITTFIIYFFNLDSKLFYKLYKPMMKRFDEMERDRKI